MDTRHSAVSWHIDSTSGHLWLELDGRRALLPALWLRERSEAADQMDLTSHQRLYDPALLPADLAIVEVVPVLENLSIAFSDGHRWQYPVGMLAVEAGLMRDPLALPEPAPWTTATLEPTVLDWSAVDDPAEKLRAVDGFFRTGFAILRGTPTTENSLVDIASRFGPIRETNWGRLFNVRTEARATDLAYTGLALTAHTDNPYRRSVPGIQFLHCLENGATGGESTVVDGAAIVAALEAEAPEAHRVLSSLPVSFRYVADTVDDRRAAPVIDLDGDGRLRVLRLSTRLDFPAATDPGTLSLFYEGRRRLAALAADPAFEFRFKMVQGDCLMMDNHRTLHGRTAFAEDGRRFLQGCYIDHDGPESTYRVLTRRRRAAERTLAA
jgi:gamma-butyrobetaine dioxygenase